MTTHLGETGQQRDMKPYASVPEHATDEQKKKYRQNFSRALYDATQSPTVSPEERYVRERISAYLWSHFDPRPFQEIEDDFRSIVASDLSR